MAEEEKVAIKILEKSKIKEKDDEIRINREFEMLTKFNHINVILVTEIFESSNNYYCVMEYCEGGAKGKKKKQTNKKAKKKHVHKKEKLRILKCYKVDGEKVVRLRRMCEVCPPGTFLAEHDDRLYCGRCRTTYAKLADKAKAQAQKKKQPKQEKPKAEEPKEAAAPKKGKKGKK